MRSKLVSTVYEYLEVITDLQRGGLRLWFRGVSSPEYSLVPALLRSAEAQWESNYVHTFLVSYRSYVSETPQNPWDLYGLMQHHGLPTRLLDWTKSPLFALYFALTQEPTRDSNRAVWVLPPYELNKRTLGIPSVFCPGGMASRSIKAGKGQALNLDAYLPEALDPNDSYELPLDPIAIEAPLSHSRIRGQLGCFTVHGASPKPLEDYFTDDDMPPYLARVDLDTERNRHAFLEPLIGWGINEEAIYQDLDSLAARIRREQGY
jgi:FRG domain-containing protein